MKQQIEALGEDVNDLVHDRLVNTETVILENINKLSTTLTSLTQKCYPQPLDEYSKTAENQEAQESNGFFNQTAATATEMEGMVTSVRQAAGKVDVATTRMQETLVKVEEIAAKVDEGAASMEEVVAKVAVVAARMDNVAARVEKMISYLEEAQNRTQHTGINESVSALVILSFTDLPINVINLLIFPPLSPPPHHRSHHYHNNHYMLLSSRFPLLSSPFSLTF